MKDNIDSKIAKKSLQEDIMKMENIHTVFAIKNIFKSCEKFRLQHAVLDQFKREAKTFTDHKEFVENAAKCNRWINSKSACDFWKLGRCSDSNLIIIYLLLKRKSNPINIFEALDKVDFVAEWKLNFQEPFSNVNKYQGGSC